MTREASSFPVRRPSPTTTARITGSVGVLILAAGTFANVVGGRTLVAGDPAATARNLVASEGLVRLGIVSNLAMTVLFVVYAALLYELLAPVDRLRARLMLLFAACCVPLYMLNQLGHYAALELARAGSLDRMAFALDLHKHGNLIAAIFFGLWLYPYGRLVYASRFLPRLLGAFLMLGSLGYLILFVQSFLFPGTEATLSTSPPLVVTHLSELAAMLWLLVRGVDAQVWKERAAEAARV